MLSYARARIGVQRQSRSLLAGETYVIARKESNGPHHRPEESHLPKHSVNARRLGAEDNRNRAIGSRKSGTLSAEYSGSM